MKKALCRLYYLYNFPTVIKAIQIIMFLFRKQQKSKKQQTTNILMTFKKGYLKIKKVPTLGELLKSEDTAN